MLRASSAIYRGPMVGLRLTGHDDLKPLTFFANQIADWDANIVKIDEGGT